LIVQEESLGRKPNVKEVITHCKTAYVSMHGNFMDLENVLNQKILFLVHAG
jgi:hypothetical protein